MRSLHAVFTSLLVVVSTAGVASAQFGLCGAPELVKIPRQQQSLLPQYTYDNRPQYDSSQPVVVQHHYYPVPVGKGYQQNVAYQPNGYPQNAAYRQNVAYQQAAANVTQRPAAPQPASAYVWPNVAYAAPARSSVHQSLMSEPAPPVPGQMQAAQPTAGPSRLNTISKMLRETRSVEPMAAAEDSGLSTGDASLMTSCGCDDYCQPDCGECLSCCGDRCCPWYVLATELNMGRNQANGIWTTYESADLTNQMMKSNFGLQWKTGGEIRFGRRFCCDAWAVEFVYWTLTPFEGMASASVPDGTVSSTLEVAEVEFAGSGGTVNAAAIFNNSAEQRLWRTDEFHNFELNLLRGSFCDNGGWPWDTQWCMGFRYLRFRDRLIYGAVANNNTWGSDGGIHEAYVNDHARNNLFAFQFGFETRTARRHNLQLFLSPKIAVGCNHIENEYQIYRGDGVVGRPTAASGVVGSFPVSSTKDVFSLVTQIDIGVDWRFAANWSARIGYRLMVATGMGLADNQIPFYIVDIPEVEDIDHNAELILHGGYLGLTYNF